MADSNEKKTSSFDSPDRDLHFTHPKTDRKTIRYIRDDIQIKLLYSHALGLKKVTVPCQLDDISSKGLLVITDKKLALNKKLILVITFTDGKEFRIIGRVIRQCPDLPHRYGIKFEQQENSLGDYLLKTQTDLIFK